MDTKILGRVLKLASRGRLGPLLETLTQKPHITVRESGEKISTDFHGGDGSYGEEDHGGKDLRCVREELGRQRDQLRSAEEQVRELRQTLREERDELRVWPHDYRK